MCVEKLQTIIYMKYMGRTCIFHTKYRERNWLRNLKNSRLLYERKYADLEMKAKNGKSEVRSVTFIQARADLYLYTSAYYEKSTL